MKSRIKLLIAALTSLSLLAGCSSSASGSGNGSAASSSGKEETAAPSVTSESTEAGNTPIIIYFSATGHTKNIADEIASYTNGEEYEVTPADPYTADDLNWSDENSRVVQEYQDPSKQNVSFDEIDIPDWDSTDVVFVGYPIWWQDASWVMKSFVRQVDFTGKTVIPFWTSSSSEAADSGKNLGAAAGTGNWKEGKRFSGSASTDEVDSWVDSLNLQ